MTGLGKWAGAVRRTCNSPRLKTQGKNSSRRKSLLSKKEPTSCSGESAAVHFVHMDFLSFGDETKRSDNDPSVAKTVKIFSVAGNDDPASNQEKETRFSGGIPSR